MTNKTKKILIGGGAAIALAALAAGAVQAQGGWHGHGHRMMGGQMMHKILAQFDTDQNGELTSQEIDATINARFAKYDANSDGKLSLDEFEGLLMETTQPMSVRAFQFLDPNGDAAITKAELDAAKTRLVERMDRNDDGIISADDRRGRKYGMGRGDGKMRQGMMGRGYGPGSQNCDGRGMGRYSDDN